MSLEEAQALYDKFKGDNEEGVIFVGADGQLYLIGEEEVQAAIQELL